jgi:hypothetical protein
MDTKVGKVGRTAALVLLVASAIPAARAFGDQEEPHGPAAPSDRFPSHEFRVAAHQPPGVQLGFHYGLLQPILFHGFNAAVDARWRRLIVTYSHGAALDVTSVLPESERAAGLQAHMRFTTGGGVGVLIVDELYLLADVKYHRFDLSLGTEHPSYDTMTIGGEIGWRFFIWKGLYASPVVRYWPNVWTSAPSGGVSLKGGALVHQPLAQGDRGLFANLLLGWAFNL